MSKKTLSIVFALALSCLALSNFQSERDKEPQLRLTGAPVKYRALSGFDSYYTGPGSDAIRKPKGGLLLHGGGEWSPEPFRWMIEQSDGGDIVVIRAHGTDEYNQYLFRLGGAHSIETLVFGSRDAAFDPYVLEKIRNAEAIFFSGGDQWDYVSFFADTPLQKEIESRISRGLVLGGSSAGLAILGQFAFSAEKGTLNSDELLKDPDDPRISIESSFLRHPLLKNMITETHFRARDRMGRLLVFLTHISENGWSPNAKAVAVDEDTALALTAGGQAKVLGPGDVYMVQITNPSPTREPHRPFEMSRARIEKHVSGEEFNFRSRASDKSANVYTLKSQAGRLSSSSGSIYNR